MTADHWVVLPSFTCSSDTRAHTRAHTHFSGVCISFLLSSVICDVWFGLDAGVHDVTLVLEGSSPVCHNM